MEWLLANPQIHSTFASLGSMQGETYIMNNDCLSILEEINCKLSVEGEWLWKKILKLILKYGGIFRSHIKNLSTSNWIRTECQERSNASTYPRKRFQDYRCCHQIAGQFNSSHWMSFVGGSDVSHRNRSPYNLRTEPITVDQQRSVCRHSYYQSCDRPYEKYLGKRS